MLRHEITCNHCGMILQSLEDKQAKYHIRMTSFPIVYETIDGKETWMEVFSGVGEVHLCSVKCLTAFMEDAFDTPVVPIKAEKEDKSDKLPLF